MQNKFQTIINKCKFLEGKKLNEYLGYINEIELMRKRIKSFREYAEKINKKTGGNIQVKDIPEQDDGQEEMEESQVHQEFNENNNANENQ